MTFDRWSTLGPRSLALLAAAIVAASPALSQTTPAQPRPAQPRPAQPAQPAQPAPQPAAGQGPAIVQVKPEPQQADWVKVCGKDQGTNKEICYTTRDFVSDQGQPVLAVAVYDVKGDAQKIVRFLMPLGLLLAPGIRYSSDNGPAQSGRYAICFPNGCFAEGPVPEAVINGMKKATQLNISVQNQFTREVTFQVPMAGFGKAYDGPAIDPAVLEAQQKQLQEQMQKQADEMRKKLDPGAAPPPVPTPAVPGAPLAVPAPKP
jgi:invasion protein IalB